MNMSTAILLLVGLYGSLVLEIVILIWWLNKNSINVQITKGAEGVYLSSSGRYRIVRSKHFKNRLCHIFDFFRRKPLDIDFDDVKDYFIITESIPFFGVKQTLKLFLGTDPKTGVERLEAWFPTYNESLAPVIVNSKIAFTETTRADLYESTKMEMSSAEVMQKIVLPLSLIVLAIACLIFFPKIYTSIKEAGNVAIETAISRFADTMSKIAPLG